MKLESKLLVSLGKRTDHVVLRRELAQLGSKSQLTAVIKRLIANGRLIRLSPGIYAKTLCNSQGGCELAASPDLLAREIFTKTGRMPNISLIESMEERSPAFETKLANKLPAALPKLPNDIAHLPVQGVGAFVADLAKAYGVAYARTRLDDFAEAVTRLAGDDERLDVTGKLLATLRKKSVIDGRQLARLMTNHMREQQNAVRSVRGLPQSRLSEKHRG
ncbi:hypothetical protein BH10PSE18_BH10PSE18_46050 [soil metagenome]